MPKTKKDPSNGMIQNFEGRFVDRDKGAIKIRTRERANGNFVIYLDVYDHGKRKCVSLDLYLVPEAGRNDTINKTRNNKTWEQAKAIKAARLIDKQNGDNGFSKFADRSKMEVTAYLDRLIEAEEKAGSKRAYQDRSFKNHLQIFTKGERITFIHIDRNFILRFIDYLKHEAQNLNIVKNKKSKSKYYIKKEQRPISTGTQRNMMKRFSNMLTKAVKDEIIEYHPFARLAKDEMIQGERTQVCYLTKDEVQSLINTPCNDDLLKRSFLFGCSTGLRYSDVSTLTWGNICDDPIMGKVIKKKIVKTKRDEVFPLPLPAMRFMPERNGAADSGIIFPLKYNQAMLTRLEEWTKSAGITKHVTFHVSRHTAATMNLALGANIATVSKLLGHKNITTTQIYAEVIDESMKKAVSLQDNIFNFDNIK